MTRLSPIDSRPYAWPLAAPWSVEDTALILCDLQEHFSLPGNLYHALGAELADIKRVMNACEDLLISCRRLGITPVYLRYMPSVGFADLPQPMKKRLQSIGDLDRLLPQRGMATVEIAEPVRPARDEPVIDHPAWNPFIASGLGNVLHYLGRTNVIVAGIAADTALVSLVREATDRGYECLMVRDACLATSASALETICADIVMGNGIFGCVAAVAALDDAFRSPCAS